MSMDIDVRFVKDDEMVDYEDVKNLLHYFGLTDLSVEKITLSFKNSLYKVFALNSSNEVIGCGRAISDGVAQSSIFNIAVAETYQSQGIGKEIVNLLINQAEGQVITLYTAPWSVDWYKKQGFHLLNTGLIMFLPDQIEWMIENKFIE